MFSSTLCFVLLTLGFHFTYELRFHKDKNELRKRINRQTPVAVPAAVEKVIPKETVPAAAEKVIPKNLPVPRGSTKGVVIGVCTVIAIIGIAAAIWWYLKVYQKTDKSGKKPRNFMKKFYGGKKGKHTYQPVGKDAEDHVFEDDDLFEGMKFQFDEETKYETSKHKNDNTKAPPLPKKQKNKRKVYQSNKKETDYTYDTPKTKDQQKDKRKTTENKYDVPMPRGKNPPKKAPRKPQEGKQTDKKRNDKQVVNVSLHDNFNINPRYNRHGFQPVPDRSRHFDYHQSAEVCKTSKNRVPNKSRSRNFEETGMDAEEFSKYIGRVPKKIRKKDVLDEYDEVDERYYNRSIPSSSVERAWVRKAKSEDFKKKAKREIANLKKYSRKNKQINKTTKLHNTSSDNREYHSDTESIPTLLRLPKHESREIRHKNKGNSSDTESTLTFD